MDRPEFVTSIRRSWEFLAKVTLEETFASSDPLPLSTEFRDMVLAGASSHLDLFSYCLSNSYYNFMLFDHSFFQFGWTTSGDLRYAFYPNPYVSHSSAVYSFRKYREMLAENRITDDEFLGLAKSLGARGDIPIFRYEYSVSQYVSLAHPTSHMHIGVHGENRWAVRRILTPLAFLMLIIKQYYPDEWALGKFMNGEIENNQFESDLIAERGNCRIIAPEYFCADEERSFYFA